MEQKYYWSPSCYWQLEEPSIIAINEQKFNGTATTVLPEIYFLAQKGIEKGVLINKIKTSKNIEVTELVESLIKSKILVSSIQAPAEVFAPQSIIFNSNYDVSTFIIPENLDKFKKEKLHREITQGEQTLKLIPSSELPENISKRRTIREFSEKIIPFSTFSNVLASLMQSKDAAGNILYYYASAGGLYPIDVYIYVKANRIENIKPGLYYYSPIDNSLRLFSKSCVITEESHYSINKSIFNSSAFSMFMVYNAGVTMPKYGGMGYFYSLLDAGIMIQLLTTVCENNNMGLCSIGDMDFKRISKYFKLEANQVHVHTIEFGLKK